MIDSRSRVEDILNVILGNLDPSVLQPPQSRVEDLLQKLNEMISDFDGKIPVHICTYDEYDHETLMPTIEDPDENTFYLVPANESGDDMYIEWIFTEGNRWERFGSGGGTVTIEQSDWNQNDSTQADFIKNKPDLTLKLDKNQGIANHGRVMTVNNSGVVVPAKIEGGNITVTETFETGEDYSLGIEGDGTGGVSDVKVGGATVVSQGVANIPLAGTNSIGAVKIAADYGLVNDNELGLKTDPALAGTIKTGLNTNKPIVPSTQHNSVFYGLAKAAGDSTQSLSANTVGTYTDAAKDKILSMLGVSDLIAASEGSTASKAYSVGEMFIFNGKLYEATDTIAIGDAIVSGINCDVVLLGDEVTDLKSQMSAAENKIGYEVDITSRFTFVQGGGVRPGGGTSSSSIASRTDYTDISGFDAIRLTRRKLVDKGSYGLAFYDDAGKLENESISGVDENYGAESITSEVSLIQVPAGAKWLRTTWIRNNQSYYSDHTFSCIGIVNASRIAADDGTVAVDEKINRLHGHINYGYSLQKYNQPATTINTENGQCIGVENENEIYTINYDGTGSTYPKRIRLTGGILRTAGNTNYKSWVGALQLTEGKKYRVALTKLSGTGTYNGIAYTPSISVYESQGASTIATTIEQTDTEYIVEFTSPAGKINIALYLEATSVLTNFKAQVTLTEVAGSGDVADYYIAEIADTVAKVRAENTSPALVFLWTTDIHRYSSNADGVQNFGAMIANMTSFVKQVPCDFVVDTGDLTDGDKTQAVTLGRAYECLTDFMSIGVPYLWSQGNHDTNYATSGQPYLFTKGQCYQAYFPATKGAAYNAGENGTEYYIDYDALGVRVISLNANNVTEHVEYAYGLTTAAWLADALDTDKTVILFVHQSPYTAQVYSNTSTNGAADIRTALEAFVTGGGNLIMLSGHSHNDVAFINPFLSVMQDCQRFNAVATDVTDEAHDMTGYIDVVRKNARAQYATTEDLWSVGIYKPGANELSLIRFGAGKDRYFHVTAIAPATLTTKLTGTITWSSSDTDVATVSDGVVTGVAIGTCAILAKDEAGNYECWIVTV